MTVTALCTPHGGAVIPDYYRAILEMQVAWPQHQFIQIEVDMMIVGKARNVLVNTTLPLNAEVLFWVDNDTLIPPNAGILIDQALELGVVSGVYYNRRSPYTPQVYIKATEPEVKNMYWPDVELPDTGMVRRDAVGAGCLAMRADLFTKLQDAWVPRRTAAAEAIRKFDPGIAEIVELLSPWFEFLDRKGEDLYICERLRDIGQDVWVNCDIQCKHLSLIAIEQAHFKFLVDSGMLKKALVGVGGER